MKYVPSKDEKVADSMYRARAQRHDVMNGRELLLERCGPYTVNSGEYDKEVSCCELYLKQQ